MEYNEQVNRERLMLRLGGGLAVLGALGYLVSALWHGDLPDQTTEIALEHIADRPEWHLVHLIGILSVLLWVGALAYSLSRGPSWLLGRMAVLAVVIGAAVFIVDYSIDGYELKNVADAWQAASAPEKEDELLVAEAMFGILGGTFRSFIAWLYGLPYLLLGLAVALSDEYPRWLGWVAAAAGAGAVVAGTTLFLDVPFVTFPLLFGGFVIPLNIWLAVMGLLMWRRAALTPRHQANKR
jgi:hypothetical protein